MLISKIVNILYIIIIKFNLERLSYSKIVNSVETLNLYEEGNNTKNLENYFI